MMKPELRPLILAVVLSAMSLPALAELVVVVNPKSTAGAMNQEQIAQFFLGISTTLRPLDQADGSPIRAEFYKKVAEKEPSQVKAIWSKLVFTGKGKPPKEYSSSADVKKAIDADPNAIGYIEKSAVDSSVKVIFTVP
jgi:ABC-type phosphate transport system substrate-binding protein